jgi:cytochrome o ubiquinol oxidase subunit 2
VVKTVFKVIILALVALSIVIGAILFFKGVNVAVLNPQGEIADQQRALLIFATALSLIVVVPVYTLLALFAWRYRATNKKAKYRPNWANNKWLEITWWGIPTVIVLVLAVITWRTSHELDPYRALESDTKPLEVQVVAMQWKWLFIYPEQQVASVNLLQIPEKTPINLTLTSDAPMNAFWVPSLGSQIYAMSGMSSKLHLIANNTGDYHGSSANISGEGFSDMAFTVRAGSQADFDNWVQSAKASSGGLTMSSYEELARPAAIKQPVTYVLGDDGLYDKIIMKYMMPPAEMEGM